MNTQIQWGFNGRYANSCENLANRAMVFFGADEEQARRFGNAFAADYGNWKKKTKEDGVTLKFGKLDKDGNITITEVEKMVASGVSTPAISIANAIYALDKAITAKNGLVYAECSLKLVKRLNDWLFQVETELVEVE